jgi:geranylgeranyl reductase family protein
MRAGYVRIPLAYPNRGYSIVISEVALIYDAIVVGAGPAGAILAYLLGKSGLRVLLLEKANLPRYKTCGGGLTFKAIRDLPFDVRSTVEIEAGGGIVTYHGQQLLRAEVQQPFAWLVMRDRFDHFLVQQAVNTGVELLDGVTVTGIEEEPHCILVQTTRGAFRASLLAAADGVNSIIASLAGLLLHREVGLALEAEVSVPTAAFEIQGNYATFDFGALQHGYGWIFPKSDHLSVGIFRAYPGKGAGMKGTLSGFIASQPVLRDCQTLSLRGQLIPLGGVSSLLHKGRILLLGDAANLADPWLGEGIFYAIRSARIAAEEIIHFLKGNFSDLSNYTSRINLEIVNHLRQARQLARLIYQFPWIGSYLLSKSLMMQQIIFGAIRGDKTFRQVNQTLVRQLPTILVQTLRGG